MQKQLVEYRDVVLYNTAQQVVKTIKHTNLSHGPLKGMRNVS